MAWICYKFNPTWVQFNSIQSRSKQVTFEHDIWFPRPLTQSTSPLILWVGSRNEIWRGKWLWYGCLPPLPFIIWDPINHLLNWLIPFLHHLMCIHQLLHELVNELKMFKRFLDSLNFLFWSYFLRDLLHCCKWVKFSIHCREIYNLIVKYCSIHKFGLLIERMTEFDLNLSSTRLCSKLVWIQLEFDWVFKWILKLVSKLNFIIWTRL